MDDEPVVNINVLVDSKREYIDQLGRGLLRPVFESLRMMVLDAMNVSKKNGMDPMRALSVLLSEVPKWDQQIVEEETNGIVQAVPYLKDLLKAYFVCASMIMGSIRMSKEKNQKMKIRVPSPERFVHMVIKNAAFDIGDDLNHFITTTDEPGKFKLNRRHVLKTVEDAIKDSLHSLMPIDDLLKEYMGDILSRDTFKGGEEGGIQDGGDDGKDDAEEIRVDEATDRDIEGSVKGVRVQQRNMRAPTSLHRFDQFDATDEDGAEEIEDF
eukprot:jgi/Mesvir1/19/Mv19997-RA.1